MSRRAPLHGVTWLAAMLLLPPAFAAMPPQAVGHLRFLGQARIASGTLFDGTEVGGLSGLLWDDRTGDFLAISDDPSSRAPARFYTLRVDLEDGRLDDGDVRVSGVTRLTREDGTHFPEREIDGESLALLPGRTLLLGSEGNVYRGVAPSLLEIGLDGRLLRRFELPVHYTTDEARTRGVHHNKVFEGIAVDPDGRSFYTGLEGPLVQDAAPADVGVPSWVRLARWDIASGALTAEYVYPLEPVAEPPTHPDGFRVNGLVELAPLADGRLLVLERAYSEGVGNTVRLFLADPRSATDVSDRPALAGELGAIRPLAKRLLIDFAELGLPLDNLESLAFGPELPGGGRLLLLVSDNNFNPTHQVTQILAFAAGEAAPTIPAIQGAAHRSPFEGDWVYGVLGVVTAVDGRSGFWMQHAGDDDPATADGIFVSTTRATELRSGDAVRVWGRVAESARSGNLPVTRLEAFAWDLDARDRPLPEPRRLAHAPASDPLARVLPGIIVDDDQLSSFDPHTDGADFWESLEGMRVSVHDARVVGPTTRYGGIGVVAEGGRGAGPWTLRGGLRLDAADPNPERILLSSRISGTPPSVAVGDAFSAPIVGVVDHDFGHYRVVIAEPLPPVVAGARPPERSSLESGPGALTVATSNALNLGGDAPEERMARLARQIVDSLGSPDLVALQEIQDDSGATDDGTVSAHRTLGRLVAAIVAAGGPRYEFLQIEPYDGMDGGQPGGNIRNALLYDATRLGFEGRADPSDDLVARVEVTPDGPRLPVNPALIAPLDSAFEDSRKPLAAEFSVEGAPLFVIALHLNSKGGDAPLFGERQPPRRGSEAQRNRQVERIGDLVGELLAADPEARIVVLGDLNEHEFRPPLAALVARGLVNLVTQLPENDRYSYNYEANSQLLDHILVSAGLAGEAEVDIVHMNADYPFDRQTSDHDPIVARLRLP